MKDIRLVFNLVKEVLGYLAKSTFILFVVSASLRTTDVDNSSYYWSHIVFAV